MKAYSPTRNAPPLWLWVTLTALPLLLTFAFSSQDAETSGFLSLMIVKWLVSVLPPLSALDAEFLHVVIRKLAHFRLYFVLGCGLRGLSTYQRRFPAVPLAILSGAFFASLDEFHQHFSAGRAPSVFDVALDTCGVATGCALISMLFLLARRRPASD